MTQDPSSYRRILWATSIVGGATLGALLIGLIRNKAVALIGGPEAVGLLGLFTALVSMGASVTTLGLDTSAVRQLSQAAGDDETAGRVRWAIWTLAWPLALLGGAAIWLFRVPLATFAVGDRSFSNEVGWLGIAVAATVIAASQMAILQGYSRIGDLARVRLGGSILATGVGVLAIYRFGVTGIVVAVLAAPIANCLVASWVGRSLPGYSRNTDTHLYDQWKILAAIGAIVMLTNTVGSVTQLAVRSIITHELGLSATGLYHASYAIVAVNLSLVLNAMAADYYPRLSKVANEPQAMSRVLNEQLHVALVLAAPVLMAVSVAAPLVLQILYSSAFSDSALLLRLLLAAGLLRLPIWALGFVLLARGAGMAYFLGEVAAASMIPLIWLLISPFGLPGAGIAALMAAAIAFIMYVSQAKLRHEVEVTGENMRLVLMLVAALTGLTALFELNSAAALAVGGLSVAVLTWYAFSTLRSALRPG
ncbi:oligosaccharide flippase family protein [Sphingomonas daechungensis]|uniref:oligosaccharide flippase family protein n=1 Tax=Sphingomonas daechungensis TaxID=1176646 RepID=UPI003784CDB4